MADEHSAPRGLALQESRKLSAPATSQLRIPPSSLPPHIAVQGLLFLNPRSANAALLCLSSCWKPLAEPWSRTNFRPFSANPIPMTCPPPPQRPKVPQLWPAVLLSIGLALREGQKRTHALFRASVSVVHGQRPNHARDSCPAAARHTLPLAHSTLPHHRKRGAAPACKPTLGCVRRIRAFFPPPSYSPPGMAPRSPSGGTSRSRFRPAKGCAKRQSITRLQLRMDGCGEQRAYVPCSWRSCAADPEASSPSFCLRGTCALGNCMSCL
ncbi:hypothetical protein LY76DRAFT_110407 [Colletotrichum caudatum]|nr:hypothetical protein LY76DRAFT_110407 [Colletotrichum caudatum]